MNQSTLPPLPDGTPISRHELLVILHAALSVDAVEFARQAALSWLANFPGDLTVQQIHALALYQGGYDRGSAALVAKLAITDPEFLEIQLLSYLLWRDHGYDQGADARNSLFALGERVGEGPYPEWSEQLNLARRFLQADDLDQAEAPVHKALIASPNTPLVAVTHLQYSYRRGLPMMAMRDLASHYHQQWPDCLVATLLLAESLMDGGESDKAVALLHQAASQDISGQVAERLWGEDHPYRGLWPESLSSELDMPVPASVAAVLGWNQLPFDIESDLEESPETEDVPFLEDLAELTQLSWPVDESTEISAINAEFDERGLREERTDSEQPYPAPNLRSAPRRRPESAPHVVPESVRSVQDELERVARRLKRDYIVRADGRFPIYVVLTTRSGLDKVYGQAAVGVETALQRLSVAVKSRPDWGAVTLIADDPSFTQPFGLSPVNPNDPWAIKLLLVDLDAELSKTGQMIGAVLIVGGPQIVPFHHLPNPVDDEDVDVPSDNPYATRDENYFVPEWPVGRLPGDASGDPDFLINNLSAIARQHAEFSPQDQAGGVLAWLYENSLSRLLTWARRKRSGIRQSYGFTAAIWRRASTSVFRPIGDPHALLVSPPIQINITQNASNGKKGDFPRARLGYFNLHGLEDSSEWFGQRDPADPADELDYPVALRPQDIRNGGRAPQIVFTEACFGAHVIGKDIDQAMTLKFLASGTQVVVGSTCTSYGSVTTPLIAADLLGHAFWKLLRAGLPAGEALRRAKIHLAREMHRRQGYLDGEDQKTLISFVYYGDPLVQPTDLNNSYRTKGVLRPLNPAEAVKTVCERNHGSNGEAHQGEAGEAPSQETISKVKSVVEKYLPGMMDAEMSFSEPQAACLGRGHTCPTSQLGAKTIPLHLPKRNVITLSKQVVGKSLNGEPKNGNTRQVHHHYARLTMDESGQVVKLSISR